MQSTADCNQTGPQGQPRIVIVGGGFAGATTAKALERRLPQADIRLLSAENYLTYNPLLAEVVGASVLPGHVVAPLRQLVRRARVHQVDVTGIDTDERRVHYRGQGSGSFPYDHLVLACGSRANLDLVPGMGEHALPLKTVGDALDLRNRMIARLEEADLATDPGFAAGSPPSSSSAAASPGWRSPGRSATSSRRAGAGIRSGMSRRGWSSCMAAPI